MSKIEKFIGKYKISKTLRFRAVPVGKTQDNIEKKGILEKDKKRSEDYEKVKAYLDSLHRDFIENTLKKVKLNELNEYACLFFSGTKDDGDKRKMEKLEEKMRKTISNEFCNDEMYKKIFSEKILSENNEEDVSDIVSSYKGFFTSLNGYVNNRKNLYVSDAKPTSIAYRCINENLPKFLRNVECYKKVVQVIPKEQIEYMSNNLNLSPYRIEDCFNIDFFEFCLSQGGIDLYNTFIGGYSKKDGTKVQGINEIVNLYNQKNKKDKEKYKLPQFTPLFKQILSDRDTKSFSIEKLENIYEVVELVKKSYSDEMFDDIETVFSNLNYYDASGIYVKNGPAITHISMNLTKDWATIRNNWNYEYDEKHSTKKNKDIEKYEDTRNTMYKKIDSFTLEYISRLIGKDIDELEKYFENEVKNFVMDIKKTYSKLTPLFDRCQKENFDISEDEVNDIKGYLDNVKLLESFMKSFTINGKENNIDYVFYGKFTDDYDKLHEFDHIYNKVRNYITTSRKPYKLDKYKLYFDNPQLLGGWDINKEKDYRTVMLTKDGKYYFAIIDKGEHPFDNIPKDYLDNNGYYKKIIYRQIPNAAKYLSSKQIVPQNPPEEVKRILDKKKADSKSLTEEEKNIFIDYIKSDFLKNYKLLFDKNNNPYFNFAFRESGTYESLNEFFEDVERQAYSVRYENLPADYIDNLVNEGKIYLFEIYSKDFSEYSKGTNNLHTMYFKALFDNDNLKNTVFKLSGNAELFIRPASIKKDELVIHPKNQLLQNKNPLNPKKQSIFDYDLVKDKRFFENQYMLHISIEINKNERDAKKIKNINEMVRKELKDSDDNYIIGIDRGERNLLYVCVINSAGKIVEQMSLNEIINEYNGIKHTVDYQGLLDKCEKERNAQRQSWKSIENIKELKDGYISQVVHKLCQLVEKYDAIIAMENLNGGFKRGRTKFEKQVYQKFENKLINKMEYMADKKRKTTENGGILRGYQLTNGCINNSYQNGFIFYVPAWLTSKIDPTTGFVDLLKPKYTNVEEAHLWINKFNSITYDKKLDMFAFNINYSQFPRADIDYRKIWTFYTNGYRIETFRNSEKNNEFDWKEVHLTSVIKKLLEEYQINYISGKNIIDDLIQIKDKPFWNSFIKYIRLTLQMRNSITGRTDVDYIISPVINNEGTFYDSRKYLDEITLPQDADANGAYNIARKALWIIEKLKESPDEELNKVKLAITQREWLEYAQINI